MLPSVIGPPLSGVVSVRILSPWVWPKKTSTPASRAITSSTVPTSSIEAPMLFTLVAIFTPMMLSAATITVQPMDSAWICRVVGFAQISGANTEPIAAAVPAVPARNEMRAIQPVNQPKLGPTSRLDHW
jgi:hypothetical protein